MGLEAKVTAPFDEDVICRMGNPQPRGQGIGLRRLSVRTEHIASLSGSVADFLGLVIPIYIPLKQQWAIRVVGLGHESIA